MLDSIGTAAIRASRCMHTRKLVKVHQNVLIFYKGNTANIPKNFSALEIKDEVSDASEDV